jgi:hypothetical protein
VVGCSEIPLGDLAENGDDQRPRVIEVVESAVFRAGGTLGASLGRNDGDGERRREDTGSIWTITRPGVAKMLYIRIPHR